MCLILGTNPFFDAYFHSDVLGKGIFLALIALSILSWTILIYKIWITYKARQSSLEFQKMFRLHRMKPLAISCQKPANLRFSSPFMEIYGVLKRHTLELLNKNQKFCHPPTEEKDTSKISYLSPSDVDFVESHGLTTISAQTKNLESNLFILSTAVSLAPFLGLLGTVWGILTTFSELQTHAMAGPHQTVLGGISLALATTVLGLINAIPALIGYNYLKNAIKDFATEMESFCNEVLTSIELQYRKVDFS